MTIETITTIKLIPSDGFQIHRISTDERYSGSVFIPSSIPLEDFDEVEKIEANIFIGDQDNE